MGKPNLNAAKPLLRSKVSQTNFKKLLAQAQAQHDYMLTNVAFYATPAPTLASVQTAINILRSDLKDRNNKFNSGGAAPVLSCQASARIVYSNMKALQAYASNLVDPTIQPSLQRHQLALSGQALRKKRARSKGLGIVRSLRATTKSVGPNNIYFSWKKPLGMFTGRQLTTYDIHLGLDNVFSTSAWYTAVTTTSAVLPLIAKNPGQFISVWVIPRSGHIQGTPMMCGVHVPTSAL